MRQLTSISGHPIEFLKKLRQIYGNNMELNFSRYRYRRRVREDVRESFAAPLKKVNKRWLLYQLSSLAAREELALESRVLFNDKVRHIPMVDFYGMGHGQLTAILDVLPRYTRREPFVYFTGRSFHAYFPVLVSRRQWVKFMGSALLCNTPEHPRVIDQRWVGHRLIAGYSALRWSWNTERYNGFPRRVDPAVLDAPAKIKLRLRSIRVRD
jgi:hypothetical protein